MKSLALILLSALLAPAYYAISRGAMRESWPIIVTAAAALALVVVAIRYLLGSTS